MPVLQSSANLSGEPDARTLEEVPERLREGADLVIDGGELPGTPSTVVDLRDLDEEHRWHVLRDGALPRERVERALAALARQLSDAPGGARTRASRPRRAACGTARTPSHPCTGRGASLVTAAATGALQVESTTGKRTAHTPRAWAPVIQSPAKESAVSELSPDYFNRPLAEVDPEIAEALAGELHRQQATLEMIASENFVPRAVLECQGSVLTNKYAEGYPGRRYYGGCEWVDVSEQLAIDRAKELFGAEHANVQPHSGAQANTAVYHALLEPGDTIMGLSLAHGGHLTHGMRINVSGRLYEIAAYEVDRESSLIDMDEVARIARERKPKLLLAGWSAYPRAARLRRASARSPTRSARC